MTLKCRVANYDRISIKDWPHQKLARTHRPRALYPPVGKTLRISGHTISGRGTKASSARTDRRSEPCSAKPAKPQKVGPFYQWKLIVDFFKNGPTSASFSFLFSLFKQTIQFLQQINVKNVHPVYSARIRTHDLSTISRLPWPLDQLIVCRTGSLV